MVGASGIEVPNCDHLVGARSPCKAHLENRRHVAALGSLRHLHTCEGTGLPWTAIFTLSSRCRYSRLGMIDDAVKDLLIPGCIREDSIREDTSPHDPRPPFLVRHLHCAAVYVRAIRSSSIRLRDRSVVEVILSISCGDT